MIQSPVLVGRDDFLALGARRLAEAASGSGQLLFVAGEAGIGKTRLLGAITRQAKGFTVLRAAAFPGDVQSSAGLLLDLASDLPSLFTLAREGDAHRRRRRLVQDLTDLILGSDPGGPVLMVLEDLHWADELSLDVLGHLAGRVGSRRMLIAGAYRSDELYPRLPMRELRNRLMAQRLAEEIRLPRLGVAETATMTGALLGRAAPARVVEAVHARSDGIPLQGYRDAFVSAQFEQARLRAPAYAHALAAAREAAALSAHREALQLYGRAVRNLPPGVAAASVYAALGDSAAATDDNEAAAEAYRMAHSLAPDVRFAADLVPRMVAVAHLLGVGLDERVAMLRAALSSLAALSSGEPVYRSVAALRSAMAAAYMLARRLDDALEWGEAGVDGDVTLGSVLVFAGRMEEGWRLLVEATSRARDTGQEAEAARGYRMLGSSASVLVEYSLAEGWLADGIAYAERVELSNHRHYLAAHLAHVQWATGQWEAADAGARHVLADGRGGITTRITAQYVLGYLLLSRGAYAEAAVELQAALEEGERMAELQRFSLSDPCTTPPSCWTGGPWRRGIR